MEFERRNAPRRSIWVVAVFTLLLVGFGVGFTGLATYLHGANPPTEEPAVPVAYEESDAVQATPALGFLYIDKSTVAADEEQAIAVSFDDDTTPLAASIALTSADTGETQTFNATKTEDHAALFTFPAASLKAGAWDVTAVTGDDGNASFTVPVDAQAGQGATGFTVLTPIAQTQEPDPAPIPPAETTPDGATAEPPLQTTMYVATENGLTSAQTLDEALLAQVGSGVAMPQLAAGKTLKVALDPGHGGSDPGAISVAGTYESDFNWKISMATKNELSQYQGVEVFLTRGQNECPTIKERVDRAVAWGADVIISQHNNSAENPDAYGTEVYVPNNSSYNHYVYDEGDRLGTAIRAELSKLGLYDRGNKPRNAGLGPYPDGSVQDYYGITRYARLAGKTGIIVEHAFVSNRQDYEKYLSNDAALAALGVADATGIAKCYGLSKTPPTTWKPSVSTRITDDKMAVAISVAGSAPSNVSGVKIALKGGDYARTFELAAQSDGRWLVTVPLAELRNAGSYTASVIAVIGGSETPVAETTFTVASTATATMSTPSVNTKAGTITVEVQASSPVGIQEVHLPVWCDTAGGQDDIKWYTLKPTRVDANGNGTYRVTVDARDHRLQGGTYRLDLYVTERNGVFAGIVSRTAQLDLAPLNLSVEPTADGQAMTVSISGSLLDASTPILFPTWSAAGGQDDLRWYEASYDSRARAWKKTITLREHGTTGLFWIHCYLQTSGDPAFLLSTAHSAAAARGTAEVTEADWDRGNVTLKANVFSIRGISEVAFEVWCDSVGGKDDVQRYKLSPSTTDADGNGIYAYTFNVADHGRQAGLYHFDLYVTEPMGVTTYVDGLTRALGATVDPTPPPEETTPPAPSEPEADDYAIMGATETTVDQLVRFYTSSGMTYPAATYASKGAPTLRDFCQIAYDEAAAEGVKAEVLMVQVVLETGWLQFGGDVAADQCNFGGIGATGGGEPGNVFPDVRTGLRAQVQHLKAYASTAPLNQAKVDPRFDYVTRGCAPTVRGLEGRWAMGEGYGDKLMRLLDQLKRA